jgi:DNA mismatch repair protein MutS2
VTCGRAELVPIDGPKPRSKTAPLAGSTRAVSSPDPPDVSVELNLIGLRVVPALDRLDLYLDGALRANLERVRVIHGHGSGALRRAVREHLSGHPVAAKWQPAPPEEGGDGATLVTLASA